jgi:hypothetical protein
VCKSYKGVKEDDSKPSGHTQNQYVFGGQDFRALVSGLGCMLIFTLIAALNSAIVLLKLHVTYLRLHVL